MKRNEWEKLAIDHAQSGNVFDWTLRAHETVTAALRAERDALKVEVQHYREACASAGETDGHGWAETTKELTQRVEDLKGTP